MEKWACEKPESLGEKPCVWGSRRKANDKVPTQDSEHQPREPSFSIFVNPLHCASGLGTGASEEPLASTQGILGNSENMDQLKPGPKQASSPRLCPVSPLAAPASETKMEEMTKQGNGRPAKPVTNRGRNTSSSGSPTPGLKFSFLKGQRQAPGAPEKASLQHDRPWKVLCSLYSPKPNRTKCLGKGKMPAYSAGRGNCTLDVIR